MLKVRMSILQQFLNEAFCCYELRWSRGHKARGQGQGHKKNPRPRPAFPRTDTLEAKDGKARGQGQGHKHKCSPTKKKGFHKKFSGDLKKKRSSQKFFRRSPQRNVFQKNFQALHKILTIQKIVLSSSRGQANFRGLEASRPRPRTSKCVFENSTSGYEAFVLQQQYVLLVEMSSGFSFAKTSQNTIPAKTFHPFVVVSQYQSDKFW